MKKALFFVTSLLVVVSLACGFSASTANIASAQMARDADGDDPTSVFAQDEEFFAVVELANAPDDTTVKAVWTAVETDGTEPNFVIDEVELTSGSGNLHFTLTNDKLWPVGKYKVDLFLNDELSQSLEFEVEGEVAAAPEPTATPIPEPTPTPEPEPTSTPQSSAGDTLGGGSSDSGGDSVGGTSTEEEEDTGEEEALPLQPEPYVHPSGAFSFAVPVGWEPVSENENVASFGDQNSIVGVEFFNAETVYDDKSMDTFIGLYLDNFVVSGEYEILSQEKLSDGSTFVAVAAESPSGRRMDLDVFVEQHDTIMFVFYFSSFNYEELTPTWDEIIGTYKIDPEAALAADPPSEPTPTPPPPPPTPTPQPAVNPLAPPPGVARVYLQNRYGSEYNIDFGDGSGSIAVMPGAQNFYHDVAPGKYNPGLSLPGGGATNVEFEIQANEAWLILVTEDLGVRWGKVYPQ